MAYGRRYRKHYRRNRKLTKAYIYGNRSARAQSKQIATLNRKVNYIAKAHKPETRTMWREIENTFTNSSFSGNYMHWGFDPWTSTYNGGDDTVDNTFELEGNYCRCLSLSFNGLFEYTDAETVDSTSHDHSACVKIVLCQQREAVPVNTAPADYNAKDFFEVNTSVSSSDINFVKPYTTGINSTYKILGTREITLSKYQPVKHVKAFFKKCIGFCKAKGPNTTSTYPRGRFIVAILTCGLHHDTDYDAKVDFHGTMKLAFTDA